MQVRRSIRLWTASVVLIGYSMAASGSDEHYITKAQWMKAVAIADVPSEVLYAMSLQESGTTFKGKREYAPWPWVLNVGSIEEYVEDGVTKTRRAHKAKFFATREEAREFLSGEVEKGNQYVAVGMYQIHLKFNGHYVEDPLDLIEPAVNLHVASKVLEECGMRFKTMKEKLGCYYSGDYDEAGRGYATNVVGIAEKWGKPYAMRGRDEAEQSSEVPTMIASVEPTRSKNYTQFLAMLKKRETSYDVARKIVVGGVSK